MKQLTVVATDDNTPISKIGILKSNLVQNGGSQVLCSIPVGLLESEMTTQLDVNFVPNSTSVNGSFSFNLSETDMTGIVGADDLDLYVSLVIEFVQE